MGNQSENTSNDHLVKVKASASPEGAGLELAIGTEAPKALERLFPKVAVKRHAKLLISSKIFEKLQRGEQLDAGDLDYANQVFGDAEAKWMRRQQIKQRATAISQTESPQHPPGESDDSSGGEQTSEDWVNKFWDDAELISDDLLQDLYARILVSEARRPGTSSLRTLRTMRYLDRQTAETFGRVAKAVFDFAWIPRDDRLRELFDITYDDLLDLDDAGLVTSDGWLSRTIQSTRRLVTAGSRILLLDNAEGCKYDVFPLKSPGAELARHAVVERAEEHFFSVASWLHKFKPDMEVLWAEAPDPHWIGPVEALQWHPLPVSEPEDDPDPGNKPEA